MSIKTIGGLTGVVISLLAASQILAEIPSNYKSWLPFPSDKGVETYRTSEKPDAGVVRVFNRLLKSGDVALLRFKVIGYSPTSNPNPRLNPLELDVEILEEEYKQNKKLYDALLGYARDDCGRCHPIIGNSL